MIIEWIRYLVVNYGYPAGCIGTFFDSESTVLVLGGIAVRLGFLDLFVVIILSGRLGRRPTLSLRKVCLAAEKKLRLSLEYRYFYRLN